jgi:hypothetical protein
MRRSFVLFLLLSLLIGVSAADQLNIPTMAVLNMDYAKLDLELLRSRL